MSAVLWSAEFVRRWCWSDPLSVPPHYICTVVSAAAGKVSSACFLFPDTRFAFLLFHVALMVDKRGKSKVQFDRSSSFFSPHNQTPLLSFFPLHFICYVLRLFSFPAATLLTDSRLHQWFSIDLSTGPVKADGFSHLDLKNLLSKRKSWDLFYTFIRTKRLSYSGNLWFVLHPVKCCKVCWCFHIHTSAWLEHWRFQM